MRTLVLTVTLFSACFIQFQEVSGAVLRADAQPAPADLPRPLSDQPNSPDISCALWFGLYGVSDCGSIAIAQSPKCDAECKKTFLKDPDFMIKRCPETCAHGRKGQGIALLEKPAASSLKEKKPASLTQATVLQEKKPAGFDKDLAVDERPKAGALHFNHPYPVVQDSEDFDKDFVKDQNTDNGEYDAQMKYDKIRHHLSKLKKDAADKLAQKHMDEETIAKDEQQAKAMHANDERAIARTSWDIQAPVAAKEPVEPVKPVKPVHVEAAKPTLKKPTKVVDLKEPATAKAKIEKDEPKVVATPKEEKAAPSVTTVAGIDAASQDVEKAKADLENCKKELADAKAALKTAMDDLEKAKSAKEAAEKKLEQTQGPLDEAKKGEKTASEKFTAQNKEQQVAEAAFLMQQRKVDAMRLKLQIAAKKVQKIRDAEDRDGGVYPKDPLPEPKSAAKSQLLGVAALITAAFVLMA